MQKEEHRQSADQRLGIYAKGYTRNARGQITVATSSEPRQGWRYTYDGPDRLILADNTGDNALDQSFTFDTNGNMTSNSALGGYVYPAGTAPRPHAPVSAGAQSFQYDAAGNMTVGLEGRTIASDGSNRPSTVTWRGASTSQSYGPGPSGCAKPPPAARRSPQATPSGRRRRGAGFANFRTEIAVIPGHAFR